MFFLRNILIWLNDAMRAFFFLFGPIEIIASFDFVQLFRYVNKWIRCTVRITIVQNTNDINSAYQQLHAIRVPFSN